MDDTNIQPGDGTGAHLSSTAVWAAGCFAISATMISLVAIWMQLKNYRKPLLQRYVVRILWMVPIFALSSWISLVSLDAAFYIDAFRDIYEAFVIYCFFQLLVFYLGGERALLVMLHGRAYTNHLWPVSLWSKEVDVGDPYTFLFIKRGILQYVYVKPVLAAVTMLLKANNSYNDGHISLTSGYFWVSFVYNLSICLSLYCLGLFFMATQEDLEEFRPIPKFLCIKAVLFFSFWQGFAISLLVAAGLIRGTDTVDTDSLAVAIQDWLICFEMVFASVGHWYAFSHKDYTDPDIQSARLPIYYAVRDAGGIQDIIQDSLETLKGTRFNYRTFEPSEGVATDGISRSGRIMAGLRYTGGGAAKYWLPETGAAHEGDDIEQHHQHQQPPLRSDGQYDDLERAPSLYFHDVDDSDEAEELYDASKRLEFGDYNFPAIDVHDPKRTKESERRRLAREKKKQMKRHYGDPRVAPAVAATPTGKAHRYEEHQPLMSESGQGARFGKSGWNNSDTKGGGDGGDLSGSSSMMAREGCVDNVNGYVVSGGKTTKKKASGSLSRQQQQQQQPSQQQQPGGYGYQSYQQGNMFSTNGQSRQAQEHQGPLFFFLG